MPHSIWGLTITIAPVSVWIQTEIRLNSSFFIYYLGDLEKMIFVCTSLSFLTLKGDCKFYFIELLGRLSELLMLNKYLLQTFKVNSLNLYQLPLFKGLLIAGYTGIWDWEERSVVMYMCHLLVFQHPFPLPNFIGIPFIELLLWYCVGCWWVGKSSCPSPT